MFPAVYSSRYSSRQIQSQSSSPLQTIPQWTKHHACLSFPLKVRDVPKFESQNSHLAVNVLAFEDRQLIPLYSSPHRNREHTIHLLLLSDDKSNSHHYTFITNLSRLVAGRTKTKNKTHICPYCLLCFAHQHTLDNHLPNCSIHKPQSMCFPKEGEDAFWCIGRWVTPFMVSCRSARGTKNKKAQKVSTSPIPPEDTPFGRPTKFCMWSKFTDVINYAKFHLYWLSRFWAPGVRKSPFPIDLRYRSYNSVRTNVLHYDRAILDLSIDV